MVLQVEIIKVLQQGNHLFTSVHSLLHLIHTTATDTCLQACIDALFAVKGPNRLIISFTYNSFFKESDLFLCSFYSCQTEVILDLKESSSCATTKEFNHLKTAVFGSYMKTSVTLIIFFKK